MASPLRALIWTAVSSEKQKGADKISLIEQERAAREWCDQQGYEVVGVLSVPGESRSETDVLTIFEDFAAKEIYAYHDLRRMWQQPRQFDVLVAYHDSRLGRSEPLFAYVVVNVMGAGAKIYTILGGWYEPTEYQMKMFMSMASVSNEMKRFVSLTKAVKLDRAQHGKLVHSTPCWAFKVERNEKGEPIRKVPDESQRIVIEAAVGLVLEGYGWAILERELFERYGFGRNGKQFRRYTFYWLLHNPNFYGNEFIGRTSNKNERERGFTDLWIFDPTYPLPPGVKIFYNVMPAYLGDDLNELLKAELRRRRETIRGGARPQTSRKFTGLLTCYYCGRNLIFHPANKRRHFYWQCQSKYTSIKTDKCNRIRMCKEEIIQAWFDEGLRIVLKTEDAEWFLGHERDNSADELERLETSRAQIDQQINRALDEQLLTDSTEIRQRLRQRAKELGNQLEVIDRQIDGLTNRHDSNAGGARVAYERLKEFPDLETFWQTDENTINQILHGLLGDQVIVIRDKAVVGRAQRVRLAGLP